MKSSRIKEREGKHDVPKEEAVDRGLILWMLSLTPKERLLHLEQTVNSIHILRAGKKKRVIK